MQIFFFTYVINFSSSYNFSSSLMKIRWRGFVNRALAVL